MLWNKWSATSQQLRTRHTAASSVTQVKPLPVPNWHSPNCALLCMLSWVMAYSLLYTQHLAPFRTRCGKLWRLRLNKVKQNSRACHEAYGRVKEYFYKFLATALNGGEWSVSSFDHFTLGKELHHTHWIGRLNGPLDRLVSNYKLHTVFLL
jgi:hypothetical protein